MINIFKCLAFDWQNLLRVRIFVKRSKLTLSEVRLAVVVAHDFIACGHVRSQCQKGANQNFHGAHVRLALIVRQFTRHYSYTLALLFFRISHQKRHRLVEREGTWVQSCCIEQNCYRLFRTNVLRRKRF